MRLNAVTAAMKEGCCDDLFGLMSAGLEIWSCSRCENLLILMKDGALAKAKE
jgi:hypothetical protein